MNRLLLGSGEWHWPGYVTLDADPASGADIIAAIPPLPESVMAQRFDEILCVHAIEHIAPWKVPDLLGQCYECLSSGGTLVLEQPNIKYAARVLLGLVERPGEDFPGQYDMAAFYGDSRYKNDWMLHRWGYYPESLTKLLVTAGFLPANIQEESAIYHKPARDFRLVAKK